MTAATFQIRELVLAANDIANKGPLKKDTGFPEPLNSDRNTTLRHPDAEVGPNATIESQDISLTRTRSRHSWLHHHHSHKSSRHGHTSSTNVPVLDVNEMDQGITDADGSTAAAAGGDGGQVEGEHNPEVEGTVGAQKEERAPDVRRVSAGTMAFVDGAKDGGSIFGAHEIGEEDEVGQKRRRTVSGMLHKLHIRG